MKKRVCLFSAGLLIISSVYARASEQRVKLKDLPEAVQKTVREQSKGAKVRGLSKETKGGKTYYELELRVNHHNKDVLIDSTGAVVEIEQEVALSSLPVAAKAEIEKQVGGGKILSVESITENNTITAYEAHLIKAGKRSEIKVTPDGKLLSVESAVEKGSGERKPKKLH
jgi:uncharacterized membrane protein YkoI